MLKITIFLVGIVSLASCTNGIRENIDSIIKLSDEKSPLIIEALYCYRTIGKVNCYTEPLKGQEANRLVGYEGVSPRSASGTGPLRP
jgi:hypothetical protein